MDSRNRSTYLQRGRFYSLACNRNMQLGFDLPLGRAWKTQYDRQDHDQSAAIISF